MKYAASTPAFDRALSVEIAASEQIRMRVLAGTLAILLLGDQLLFLFARETLAQFTGRLLPTWLPLKVFGPFLAYEIVTLVALRYRRADGHPLVDESMHKSAGHIRCLADAAVLRLHRRLDLAPGLCVSGVHRSRCGNHISYLG